MAKLGLYSKIAFLVLFLIGVFFAIRSMTPEKVQTAFQALGIEPGADGQPGFQPGGGALESGQTRRTLCKTRVSAVRFPDGRSVVEKRSGLNLEWVAEEAAAENSSSEPKPLNYLAIEKWFSRHCQFVAGAVSEGEESKPGALEPSNEPASYVKFEYVSGGEWSLSKSGTVLFSAEDPSDRFESADLEQALLELRSIAGFPVDSGDR